MLNTDTTVTTVLIDATRLGCSVNGNPTWLLHTTDAGDVRTMSDAGDAYAVGNYLPRRHKGELGTPVTLTLTRTGRARHVTPTGPAVMLCTDRDDRCGRAAGHAGPCDWCD